MPELPITKEQALRAAKWIKDNFGSQISLALQGSNFSSEHAYAIACQETAYVWLNWIDKYAPDAILGRMIFDASGDLNGNRSVFPKNTDEFKSKFGNEFAEMLIAEANLTRHWREYSPKKWVYCGWGIFQYDLQYILKDEVFWRQKQWYSIDECLKRLLQELNTKWKANPGNYSKIFETYNGSGQRARDYSSNVMQYYTWIKEAGI